MAHRKAWCPPEGEVPDLLHPVVIDPELSFLPFHGMGGAKFSGLKMVGRSAAKTLSFPPEGVTLVHRRLADTFAIGRTWGPVDPGFARIRIGVGRQSNSCGH